MTQVVAVAAEDQRAQRLQIAFALIRITTQARRKRSVLRIACEHKAAHSQQLHLSEEWSAPGEEWIEGHSKDLRQGFAPLQRPLNSNTLLHLCEIQFQVDYGTIQQNLLVRRRQTEFQETGVASSVVVQPAAIQQTAHEPRKLQRHH